MKTMNQKNNSEPTVFKGNKTMTTENRFSRLAFAMIMMVAFLALTSLPVLADPPVTGPNGHLKQTMECEWAVTNPGADPEDYVNDPNDDLVKLATSLNNDPVEIYNWVYKNIYFPQFLYKEGGYQYYYYKHSRLGARGAYLNRIGNHWDQSSLLIALLRISKIPARYVKLDGTDLVYVEAWMNLDNYNSAAQGSQKGWVPMVPWLKEIDLIKGEDLFRDVADMNNDPVPDGLDFDFKDYLSTIKYKSALELYENKLQGYLSTNRPGKAIKDISYKEKLIDRTGSILPRSLPKNLISKNKTRFIEPANEDREYINIKILKTDETSLLDYTLYLPKVAGKRFALDWIYSGASFTPVFKIEGAPVQTSSTALAKEDDFYIKYTTASQGTVIRPQRIAGTYIHMGFDPLSASMRTIEKAKKTLQTVDASKVLNPSTHEEYLGLMGTVLVETFLNRLYENSKRAGKYFYGAQLWNLSPTFIYTKYNSEEHPIPTDGESKFYYHPQWNIDAQSMGAFYKWDDVNGKIVSLNWNAPIHKTFRLLYGYGASYDEGRIFEDWMDTPGASTIRGLMVANEDISGTGNKVVDLTSADIVNETVEKTCYFNTINVQDDGSDFINTAEAYNGFHFLNVKRVPDGWTEPGSGLQINSGAVDGAFGAMVWNEPSQSGYQFTISRGTKFDLKSIKVSGLIDGVQYRFDGYRRTTDNKFTKVYSIPVTANVAPQTKTFNWSDINKIDIHQITSLKGPIVLDNLKYVRKEFIPNLDNQTSLHLGVNSVMQIMNYLLDGSTVVTPVQVVNYAGLSGDIRIVHSDSGDLYSFGMDNGGAASPITQNDSFVQDTKNFTLDNDYQNSIVSNSFSNDYFIDINSTPTTYNIDSDSINREVSLVGDPVDMVQGEFYCQENPDIKINSPGFDLSISRTYKSRLIYNGPFGFGWSWTHGERIVPMENGAVLYYNNEGKAFDIKYENGSYVHPKGTRFTLEKTAQGYIVTQNQSREKFYFGNDGLLVKKEDPFGNTLEFEYTNLTLPDKITKITDRLGRSLVLTYNANGKVIKVTDFEGRYCKYAYSGDDLVTFTDLEGNETQYSYLTGQDNKFNNHNMKKYTLPNGDWLEIGYYKNDTVAYHTNKKGETFNFMYSRLNRYSETWNEEGYYRKAFYNENGDVVRIDYEDGTIESMEYDAHHNKASHTDGNGNTTTFQYYPDGTSAGQKDVIAAKRKLYVKTDALGSKWTYEYNSTNNPFAPTKITDPENRVTEFEYNPDTSLHKKIQAPGYENTLDGELVESAGAPGLITTYEYDTKGNVLKVTSPDTSFIENTYDSDGLYLVSSKDKNGRITQYDYYDSCGPDRADWKAIGALKSKTLALEDGEAKFSYEYNLYGQVTQEINPLNESTTFAYDVNRKLKEKIENNGAKTQYFYDTARDIVSGAKLIKVIDPEGFEETYTYDKVGNRITKTDKNGNTTEYFYDGMNRPLGEMNALGLSQWLSYDGAGNVVSKTDQNGNTTTLEYDRANRLVKVTTPQGESDGYFTAYEYDKTGKKTIETDAEGFKTKYEYDALGRLTVKTVGYDSAIPRTTQYRYNDAGRLTREIAPQGNYTAFKYDAAGNLLAQKSYDKDGTTLLQHIAFEYYPDARNLLKSKTVKNGHQINGMDADIVTQFEYDLLGRKSKEIDAEGGITRFEYDDTGNLAAKTDPKGAITQYDYDLNHRKISVTDALGHTSSITHDGVGNVLTSIDPLGNATRYYYDAANRKIGVENALGATTTFDYDANGNLVATTDPKGNVTRAEYDPDNRAVKQIDALGKETLITYTPSGRVKTTTTPKGIVTERFYDDPTGKVTQIIQAKDSPDQAVTAYAYDLNGQLKQETNALGIVTSYVYDGLGRVLEKRTGMDADGIETLPAGSSAALIETFTYTPAGLVRTQTDPKGKVTAFEYNALGQQVKQTDPELNVTTFEYDANQNLTAVYYPGNVIDTYEYDAANRVIVKNEQGVETRLIYNANDQVITQMNGRSVDTVFSYDALNRLKKKTRGLNTPDQSTARYGYDANGNLVWITNGLNKTIFYQYDALNRRTLETRASETDPDTLDPDAIDYSGFTSAKQVRYDDGGNPDRIKRADNSYVYYTYDDMDRVTQVKHGSTLEQSFTYDELSRMTSAVDYNRNKQTRTVTFDNYNLYSLHTTETQGSRQVGMAYDDNGNLTQVNYPSVKTIEKTYTDNNLLSTVKNTTANVTLATMDQYNGLGSIKEMTLGNGITVSFGYDAHDREASRTYTKSVDFYKHEITDRDGQGNITAETITTPWAVAWKTHTYDNLDRLKTSDNTNGPDLSWSYDAEGNWTATNQNGPDETRTVDNDNQYVSITGDTPTYDANGNMTKFAGLTYIYDWANRLVQVKQGTILKQEYFYDALNRRVEKWDNSSGTAVVFEYVYQDSQVIESYKDGVLDKTFAYADYMDDPVAMTSGGSRYYYVKDRQFSIKAVTDANGNVVESYEYSAYGVMTIFDSSHTDITAAGSAIGNPYGFTGRRWDKFTGLWYYRNRMYSPTLGRFMQKDPAGFVDGLNLYAYVLNNPLRYTDPDGLMARAAYDATKDVINTSINYWDNKIDNAIEWHNNLGNYYPDAKIVSGTGNIGVLATLTYGADVLINSESGEFSVFAKGGFEGGLTAFGGSVSAGAIWNLEENAKYEGPSLAATVGTPFDFVSVSGLVSSDEILTTKISEDPYYGGTINIGASLMPLPTAAIESSTSKEIITIPYLGYLLDPIGTIMNKVDQ